jgi:hypothetical protein
LQPAAHRDLVFVLLLALVAEPAGVEGGEALEPHPAAHRQSGRQPPPHLGARGAGLALADLPSGLVPVDGDVGGVAHEQPAMDQVVVDDVGPRAGGLGDRISRRVGEGLDVGGSGGERIVALAQQHRTDAVHRDAQAVGEHHQPAQREPVADREGTQAVGWNAQAVGQLEQVDEGQIERVAQQRGVGEHEAR